MTRAVSMMSRLGLPAMLLWSSGCADDLKKQNDLLQQDNQRMLSELEACRDELAQARQSSDNCQQQLAAAQRDNQNLQSMLATRPTEIVREPSVPEGWTAVPGGAMIALEGDVLFASGKAVLREDAKPTLQRIASTIKSQYSDRDILVYGHTDTQPIKKSGWEDNYELSAQRALSVVRYLGAQGVGLTRLVACGAGEHRPRQPNTSDPGRAKNRRVELFALNSAGVVTSP